VNVVLDHWERTGVLPQLVSSDDATAAGVPGKICWRPEWRWSVSAAPKERKLRRRRIEPAGLPGGAANRSAVESLMFTLKRATSLVNYSAGRMKNVRAELTEKVLAYNLDQILRVRERQARERLERSVTA